MTAALSHMEALNARTAAGQKILPLRLPVAAIEWSCHAPTTVRDAAGEVLAECGGHGRGGDEDEQIAAEIVRRVNAHDELLKALAQAATSMGAISTLLLDHADGIARVHALAANDVRAEARMLRCHADQARAAVAKASA